LTPPPPKKKKRFLREGIDHAREFCPIYEAVEGKVEVKAKAKVKVEVGLGRHEVFVCFWFLICVL
jgi:hypothetical protein